MSFCTILIRLCRHCVTLWRLWMTRQHYPNMEVRKMWNWISWYLRLGWKCECVRVEPEPDSRWFGTRIELWEHIHTGEQREVRVHGFLGDL